MYLKSKSKSKVKKVNLKTEKSKLIFISLLVIISLSMIFLLLISIITDIVYKLRLSERKNYRREDSRLERIGRYLSDNVKLPETITDYDTVRLLRYLNLSKEISIKNNLSDDNTIWYNYIIFSFSSIPRVTEREELYNLLHSNGGIEEVFKHVFDSEAVGVKYISYYYSLLTCTPKLNGVTYPYLITHKLSYTIPDYSKDLKSRDLDKIMEEYIISLFSLKSTDSRHTEVIESMYRLIGYNLSNDIL